MYYLHLQIIMLFCCTLNLFYTKLKKHIFFNNFLLNAYDMPDPCGIDLGVWYTSVNKMGNKEILCCIEGGKCYGKKLLSISGIMSTEIW